MSGSGGRDRSRSGGGGRDRGMRGSGGRNRSRSGSGGKDRSRRVRRSTSQGDCVWFPNIYIIDSIIFCKKVECTIDILNMCLYIIMYLKAHMYILYTCLLYVFVHVSIWSISYFIHTCPYFYFFSGCSYHFVCSVS